MTRECLHDVSIASPVVESYQVRDSAKMSVLLGVKQRIEANRSGFTRLGILCSIHLSYGGLTESKIVFVVSLVICYHLL